MKAPRGGCAPCKTERKARERLAGNHDETVAEPTQVTYLPGRGQAPPGTRYCRRCGNLLEDEAAP